MKVESDDCFICYIIIVKNYSSTVKSIKIIDANKFGGSISDFEWTELNKITDKLRLYGVISLDMSSPPPSTDIGINDLGVFLPLILPILRYINLSNNGFGNSYLSLFSRTFNWFFLTEKN